MELKYKERARWSRDHILWQASGIPVSLPIRESSALEMTDSSIAPGCNDQHALYDYTTTLHA